MISNSIDETRKLWKMAEAMLPAEKHDLKKRGDAVAKNLRETGPLRIDGVGQLMAKIPLALYIRWQQEFPGCWQDEGFTKAFLRDNPQFKAVMKSDIHNSIIV